MDGPLLERALEETLVSAAGIFSQLLLEHRGIPRHLGLPPRLPPPRLPEPTDHRLRSVLNRHYWWKTPAPACCASKFPLMHCWLRKHEEAQARRFSGPVRQPLAEWVGFRAAAEDPASAFWEITRVSGFHDPRIWGVFRAWAAEDPRGMLTAIDAERKHDATKKSEWDSLWDMAFAACASKDAKASSSVLGERVKGTEGNPRALLFRWFASDPQDALAWAWKTIPADDVEEAYECWMNVDPEAASRAALGLLWGYPHSPVHTLTGPHVWNSVDDVITQIASGFAELSPEGCAAWARSLATDRLTPSMAEHLASELESASPGEGERLARSFPEGPLRDHALAACAGSVAGRDFALGRQLVASPELTGRRAWAAASILSSLTPTDPYRANTWLSELQPLLPNDLFAWVVGNFIREAEQVAPSLAREWPLGTLP